MKLQLLQQQFIDHLTYANTASVDNHNFLEMLETRGDLQPQQQLAIYKNNMRSALQKTLSQIYPVCQKIVGEMYFKQLANHYITQTPSKHSDLNQYGEQFSQFIQRKCQQRSELHDFPYLADLMQLEWFYHALYYVEQGTAFDLVAFSQLSETEQANCSFLLAPHLKFISSAYPILSIWQLNQSLDNSSSSLSAQAEHCCIIREEYQPKIIAINDRLYQLLRAVKLHNTLAELAAKGLSDLLPKLIQSSWISGFQCHYV